MYKFLLVLIVGAFAQYIDGSLGMGYGASSASVLIGMGFLPAVVSASVHTSQILTCLASGVSHLKFGNVDKKTVLLLAPAGVVGGIVGAYFLALMSGEHIRPFVAILLLIIGIRIFVRFLWNRGVIPNLGEFSPRLLVPLGCIAGTFDAIGGGGWGPICTSTLISSNKKQPRHVIGSVNIAEFFMTVAIVVTFALTLGFGVFLWYIIIPLMIGGVIAAPLAAYTCTRVRAASLGAWVGAILIALNLKTVASYLPAGSTPPWASPELLTGIAIAFMLLLILVTQRRRNAETGGDFPAAAFAKDTELAPAGAGLGEPETGRAVPVRRSQVEVAVSVLHDRAR